MRVSAQEIPRGPLQLTFQGASNRLSSIQWGAPLLAMSCSALPLQSNVNQEPVSHQTVAWGQRGWYW